MENINQSQLLYFSEPYCHEFSATVLEAIPQADGRYTIILDKSYFYPTGGGQEHDIGVIGQSNVIDVVYDEKRRITKHIVEKTMPIGPTFCKIDWEQRLSNMQHHSGQHLLTQCVLRLYGYKTISANINASTPSTLDIVTDKLLSDAELDKAEELANRIIFENKAIKTFFIDQENINQIPFRRPPKVKNNIRVVEIDEFDLSACGGTHCSRTGEIVILKVLKNERINKKTRIHFVAGKQALILYSSYHNLIKHLTDHLNVSFQDLPKSVENLSETMITIQKKYQDLKFENLAHEADSLKEKANIIKGVFFVQAYFEDRPINEIRKLADILKEQNQIITILTTYDGTRLSIVVSCGIDINISAKDILQKLLIHFNGRGGGDSQIAQGGGLIYSEYLNGIYGEGSKIVNEML